MVKSLMQSVETKQLEQRIISLFDRTFNKVANVSTLNYRKELPRNTRRWFQSKTFETQLDSLLTEIIRLALSYADANLQEAQVAASIHYVNKTAAKKPYPLTAEAVRISTELVGEVADSIVEMLDNDEIYYRNPNQLARQIEQYWNNERYRAVRFARTFVADVAVNSELYRYAQRGVQVEFFAEIDDRTSPQCRALHGTIFDANSAEASRMRPPLHHNCRSDLLPVPVSRSVNSDRRYNNRDFRRQMDQDGNFIDGLVDEKVVRKTFDQIEVFNDKYRIDKFILDSDLERRIAGEKGLLDSLSISRTPARGDIDDIIRKYESQIRDMPYENCYAFSPDGTVMFRKSGSKSAITITMEEGKKLKGSVFTHNHPGSSSFSPADIRTACNLEMKEIRITATKNSYTMKMKDGSNFESKMWNEKIDKSMKYHNRNVRKEFENKIFSGELSTDDANLMHWHEVWSRVVKDIPQLEYIRR